MNEGPHTVTVATNNPGGGTFSCKAVASDQFGVTTDGTTVFPDVGNRVSTLSVTVPPNGSLLVVCEVNPNGTVWSVNCNQ